MGFGSWDFWDLGHWVGRGGGGGAGSEEVHEVAKCQVEGRVRFTARAKVHAMEGVRVTRRPAPGPREGQRAGMWRSGEWKGSIGSRLQHFFSGTETDAWRARHKRTRQRCYASRASSAAGFRLRASGRPRLHQYLCAVRCVSEEGGTKLCLPPFVRAACCPPAWESEGSGGHARGALGAARTELDEPAAAGDRGHPGAAVVQQRARVGGASGVGLSCSTTAEAPRTNE